MSDALPEELVRALTGDAEAAAVFEELPPSHQREYSTWVAEAKRDETRERRAEKALAMLREGAQPSGAGDA